MALGGFVLFSTVVGDAGTRLCRIAQNSRSVALDGHTGQARTGLQSQVGVRDGAEGMWVAGAVSRGRSIVQDHSQQGVVDLEAAVVVDEPEPPELVHEEVHARAGGADHLREHLL